MFDFKSLDLAKKKADVKGDKKQEQFYQLYNGALEKFRRLVGSQTFNPNDLKAIACQLLEALQLVKTQAEPYLFLAYIFYIIGDNSSAVKYLKVSRLLNPTLEGIASLQEAIVSEPIAAKVNYPVTSQQASSVNITDNNKRAPPRISPIRRIERK
jgi:hypothetical protein